MVILVMKSQVGGAVHRPDLSQGLIGGIGGIEQIWVKVELGYIDGNHRLDRYYRALTSVR